MRFIIFSIMVALAMGATAQTLRKVEVYFDPLTRTKLKESYTTLSTPPYPMHGKYQSWDEYGYKNIEGTYSNGNKHGIFTSYYDFAMASLYDKNYLGKVFGVDNYVNGQLDGLQKMFSYKTGTQQLIQQKTYSNGKQTKQEEWFNNGKPKMVATENGQNVSYYESGQKATESTLKNGVPNGRVNEWYPNGKLSFTATFTEGKYIGEVIAYREDGTVRKKAFYDPATFFNTSTIEYYSTGKAKYERKSSDGKLFKDVYYDSIAGYKSISQDWVLDPKKSDGSLVQHGKAYEFFANGSVWTESNLEYGVFNGPYKVYTTDGKILNEGQIKNGVKVGVWKMHYNEDWEDVYTIEEASYYRLIDYGATGTPPFKVSDHFISGAKQFEGTVERIDPDKIVGKAIFYHPNGKVQSEGEYDNNGLHSGYWKHYYEQGGLEREGTMSEDKEVGLWKTYHPNGQLQSKGQLSQYGTKIGTWESYDDSGKLIEAKRF